jgi:hypothetical protein
MHLFECGSCQITSLLAEILKSEGTGRGACLQLASADLRLGLSCANIGHAREQRHQRRAPLAGKLGREAASRPIRPRAIICCAVAYVQGRKALGTAGMYAEHPGEAADVEHFAHLLLDAA